MNYIYLALGILLFVLVSLDITKTTVSSNGGGSLTNYIARSIWMLFLYATRKNGRSKVLSYVGSAILAAILLTWVFTLWGSMLLMLMADKGAIKNSTTNADASLLEQLYYAGYTLSTLGVGDYIPTTDFWRLVTNITAFAGLASITASITYFIPVLQAVEHQSKLSFYISSMGHTPAQILRNSWNGKDFSSFYENTDAICQMLMQHITHHHSYPIIHYFHNHRIQFSISVGVALLAETYYLLQYGVHPQLNNKLKLIMLKNTLEQYLQLVKSEYIKDAEPDEQPPKPELDELLEAGIPLQPKETIVAAFQKELKGPRTLLTVLIETDGWTWGQVYRDEVEL
ncbi:two pore domain potassium channel family protein [Pontibacter sp. Tf4]|uniref:potassium channel family protein n=1 Tax=Pontibacter sp. Tf4 TaxID=2761620 RepID=UPI001628495F|nr:potassium channel family protein [Pontibacter sp. Tf4]MBB6611670.1 two pore domain potassium channel family protein [Pontibacter sp. Tf4]